MAEYIEREALVVRLQERRRLFADAWGDFCSMPIQDKARVDELSSCIAEVFNAPAADVVPVVRCKDCKHSRGLNEKERLCVCDNALICKNSEAHVDGWNPVWPDDFCSYGERKEDDGNG